MSRSYRTRMGKGLAAAKPFTAAQAHGSSAADGGRVCAGPGPKYCSRMSVQRSPYKATCT